MLKLIGIILLSGAVSMYGAFAASNISTAGRQRKAVISLMYAVKNGIEYGGTALDEIFANFESTELEKCGFLKMLQEKVPCALENALKSQGLLIGDREKALFTEFAVKCGKSPFADGEKKLCERYIALAENLDASLSADEKAKCELYRRLGVLCGLFSALILL